jgi:hypothetical protein
MRRKLCTFGRRLFYVMLMPMALSDRCYAMTARWADIPWSFLGNSSVNTFPLLGSRLLIMQHLDYNNGRAVFYVVRDERL